MCQVWSRSAHGFMSAITLSISNNKWSILINHYFENYNSYQKSDSRFEISGVGLLRKPEIASKDETRGAAACSPTFTAAAGQLTGLGKCADIYTPEPAREQRQNLDLALALEPQLQYCWIFPTDPILGWGIQIWSPFSNLTTLKGCMGTCIFPHT